MQSSGMEWQANEWRRNGGATSSKWVTVQILYLTVL